MLQKIPFFPRWSYSNFLDGIMLSLEDPMYFKFNNLHIGWMYGDSDTSLLLIMANFIKDAAIKLGIKFEEIVLIGSSCGGFAALYIATLIEGCNVIVVNPQIYPYDYKFYSKKFEQITGLSLQKKDKFMRNKLDIRIFNSQSNFVMAFNIKSKEDYEDQLLKFCNLNFVKLNYGVNIINKNLKIWTYCADISNPHSAMDDHLIIHPLLNLLNNNNFDRSLYFFFGDVWANNLLLKDKIRSLSNKEEKLDRISNNITIRPPVNFTVNIQKKCNSNLMLVVCSHMSNRPAFSKYKFDDYNIMSVLDAEDYYFVKYAGRLTDYIKDYSDKNKITKVLFLGCSKGGFGAILLSSLLSNYSSKIISRFLAFSPQSVLFPKNDLLYFPSYDNLIKRASKDKNLMVCLEKYGNLSNIIAKTKQNFIGKIIYSEYNETDFWEAHKIRDYRIIKHPLPFSFHGAVWAYCTNLSNYSSVKNWVDKVYENSRNEYDLGASLPKSKDKLIDELMSIPIKSSLSEEIDEMFKI